MGQESRAERLGDGKTGTDSSLALYEQAPPPSILLESQQLLGASSFMMRDVSDASVTTTTESSTTVVTLRHKRPDLSELRSTSPDGEKGDKGFSNRLMASQSMPAILQDVYSTGISKILDFIFIGNSSDATSKEVLTTNNIRRVISITETNMRVPQIQNDSEHFLHIPIRDTANALLFQYFQHTYEFIEATRRAGERVLVHCMAGVSRSPTIVIAYLMRKYRISYIKALRLTREKRPIVDPNVNFISQLNTYEAALSFFRIIPKSCDDLYEGAKNKNSSTTSATTVSVKTTKLENTETARPPRPNYLDISQINKSQSSDYKATIVHSNTSKSATTTNFSTEDTYGSSALSSSSYSLSIHSTQSSSSLNSPTASRLSIVSSPFITVNDSRTKPQAHNKKINRYCRGRHCCTNVVTTLTSTSSLSSPQFTRDWSNSSRSLTTPALGDIPSPSAEFCKLGITAVNSCFAYKRDVIAKNRRGGRRCSTSTDVSESASSGVCTESSYYDRVDDHNYVGTLEDEEINEILAHEAHEVPTVENPVFHMENKSSTRNPIISDCKNFNANAKESRLPLEFRKLNFVTGKFISNKDRENFAQNSWKCYCCSDVKNDSGKRCHSDCTHMRPPLSPLDDEDAIMSSQNQSHDQSDDLAYDDGYSEEKGDSLLSDEEANLKAEAVLHHVIKLFNFEDKFADTNNNSSLKLSGNTTAETSPSKKKARVKQIEQPAEINPEDLAQTFNTSDAKPNESSLHIEKAYRVQTKRSSNKLYPILQEEESEYETSKIPNTSDSQSLFNDSNRPLYPSLVQDSNSCNCSSTKEQSMKTTNTTIELFSTNSEGASLNKTTTATGTASISLRKNPTKSIKTDMGFDNARLDPERASISSTSSLEIFAI